jgi:hypothetical protein
MNLFRHYNDEVERGTLPMEGLEWLNLGGWLTIVVERACLDILRSHESRRLEPHGGLHLAVLDD